ncbi:carboxypeptidase-like regulatory domain-containing protein [uncultured Formosa sp.]|uniref:carboxypeptidase-like regulatory domain-containing protein n=1 Tax=uncultured Formosa sp. TaxID=255435 RepID=UPI00262F8871|nr:carboxypeptidase-like regulatory domain-containing protein [uncultured Formosa sp.]
MKKQLLILLMLFSIGTLTAQTTERVQVSGRIVVVDSEDIEGVTVYNTSTNKGTVTDKDGEFIIAAGVLDHIEISSLQFEDIHVKIDADVIKSKQLTVFLVTHVNRLNEVIIFPFGLTGILHEDLNKIKTYSIDLEGINFGIGDISAYVFPDDFHSSADMSILKQGEYYNGMDMRKITNTFLKPLFKKKESKTDKIIKQTEENLGLRGVYSHTFITENYEIPASQIDEFINYVDLNIDQNLLKEGQEIQLLEYLSKASQAFLKQ